jgi:hypothetical protein
MSASFCTKAAVTTGVLLSVWAAVGWGVLRATRPAAAPSTDPAPLARIPPFHGWPTPELIIAFTGQQHGHMKPCGCSPLFQKGGLARRQGFFEALREKDWPMLLVDLGGLLHDSTQQLASHTYLVGPDQSAAKLEITIDALQRMQYHALGIAPEDIRLESGFLSLLGMLKNIPETARLRGVSANLTIEPDLQQDVPAVQVHEIGNRKIALTSVVGEVAGKTISDIVVKWQEPATALKVVAKLPGVDLRVLLFYGSADEARRLVDAVPDFDVIIHGSTVDEPPNKPQWEGKTMMVTAGTNGKHVGVVGLFPQEHPRFELVSLDDRFPESDTMKQLLARDYLRRLQSLDLIAKQPQTPLEPGETIVGVQSCAECHPRTVEKWRKSKHAAALDAITRTGEHVNPECVSCHTTYFGRRGGFDGTERTRHLAGNQCENCHGPGGQHATEPENDQFRLKMHREQVNAEATLCRRCHDAENDPEFKFATRWPEIAHKQESLADAVEYRRKKKAR